MASIKKHDDDFVIYDYELENAVTCNSIEDVVEYGRKIGFDKQTCDEFATRVYNYEIGKPFKVNGREFIVWDDEFGGYHQYHASTKKSFSEQVNKQRQKNSIGKEEVKFGNPTFQPLFDGYYALGTAEQYLIQKTCEELGLNGFKEFVDRAIMKWYEK